MDHETILTSMLTGVTPALPDAQVKSILAAMKAFSDKQLQKMEESGVRIWPFIQGLPPEYLVKSIDDLKAPAEYKYQFRTIRISPASLAGGKITNFLRHEFAHAWDDVRTGKTPANLKKLKGDALIKELERLAHEKAPYESDSMKKLPPGKKHSMLEVLNEYKKILRLDKTKSFANEAVSETHLVADVKEFYAEGYSVFHGFEQVKQSRMLWLAPELFAYLEDEADGLGLSKPDRKQLEQILDDTEKGWRNF